MRIKQAHATFADQKKAKRENLLEEVAGKHPYHYRGVFDFHADKEWMVECPACGGNAIAADDQGDEILRDESDEFEETVEKFYVADFFSAWCANSG